MCISKYRWGHTDISIIRKSKIEYCAFLTIFINLTILAFYKVITLKIRSNENIINSTIKTIDNINESSLEIIWLVNKIKFKCTINDIRTENYCKILNSL